MKPHELESMMATYPILCSDGMGVSRQSSDTAAKRREYFTSSRLDLTRRLKTITLASWWMDGRPKTKTIRPMTTYSMKHLLEYELGIYMADGEFIAGALHAGFTAKWFNDNDTTVSLNVSGKSLPTMQDVCQLRPSHQRANLLALLADRGDEDPEIAAHFRSLVEAAPCST